MIEHWITVKAKLYRFSRYQFAMIGYLPHDHAGNAVSICTLISGSNEFLGKTFVGNSEDLGLFVLVA